MNESFDIKKYFMGWNECDIVLDANEYIYGMSITSSKFKIFLENNFINILDQLQLSFNSTITIYIDDYWKFFLYKTANLCSFMLMVCKNGHFIDRLSIYCKYDFMYNFTYDIISDTNINEINVYEIKFVCLHYANSEIINDIFIDNHIPYYIGMHPHSIKYNEFEEIESDDSMYDLMKMLYYWYPLRLARKFGTGFIYSKNARNTT